MVLLVPLLGLHDCFVENLKPLGKWFQSPWPLGDPKVIFWRPWERWWITMKHVSFPWICFCEISGQNAACWGSANATCPPAWGSRPQPVCWAQSFAFVVSGGRNAAWCPLPPALAHLHKELQPQCGPRSFSLLLGVSIRNKTIQPAEQRPGDHFLPSALMVASKLESLVAFCLVF